MSIYSYLQKKIPVDNFFSKVLLFLISIQARHVLSKNYTVQCFSGFSDVSALTSFANATDLEIEIYRPHRKAEASTTGPVVDLAKGVPEKYHKGAHVILNFYNND